VLERPMSSIAVEQAEELYRTLLQDTFQKDGNTWKVTEYLSSLKASDPSFDFRMAQNGENGGATAVIWKTGTMRGDFELNGCALHLHFMKCKLNSFEWPYISIVAVDGNGSPRCVAEGLACVERHDAYVFGVKAMLEMAPDRTSDKLLAVFANGALCSKIMDNDGLGFRNGKFFWDSYHLLHDIWPKQFGAAWTESLSSQVHEMLYAESEFEFNRVFESVLQDYRGKESILDHLREIAANREHFAYYIVKNLEGTCGKVSNNPAEQNHASVVSFVGDTLYKDPAYEIKTLLAQQRMLEKKRLTNKSSYQLRVSIEVASLTKDGVDDNVVEALKTLEKKSFELWKQEHDVLSKYDVELDDNLGSRIFSHKDYPDTPRFVPYGERCSCAIRKQYLLQCHHEIAENGGKFMMNLIDW